MKKKFLILFFALSLFLFSCISNKRITYFQYKDESRNPALIEKDTIIRRYNIAEPVYRLKPNDLLDIKISTMTPSRYNPFNDADRTLVPGQMLNTYASNQGVKTQGYYIDPAGNLHLPIIGALAIGGLTIQEAEDSISSYVSKYLESPVVRVKLLNFRFSVIGEVLHEGSLVSEDNYLTLIQALSMAGGATEYADLSRIKVIRQQREDISVFYVNLLSEDFLQSPFYFVQPGDVIVVSPLGQRAYLKYVSPNLSIFATSFSLLIAILTLFRY